MRVLDIIPHIIRKLSLSGWILYLGSREPLCNPEWVDQSEHGASSIYNIETDRSDVHCKELGVINLPAIRVVVYYLNVSQD